MISVSFIAVIIRSVVALVFIHLILERVSTQQPALKHMVDFLACSQHITKRETDPEQEDPFCRLVTTD